MAVGVATGVLLIAVAVNAIATGATLDQAIKQLPARHRIGPVAYTRYVRAADLTNGLYWYPPLGIGTAVLTLVAVAANLTAHPSSTSAVALVVAALGTIAHLGATARAAPTLLSLRHGQIEEQAGRAVLDRFARINAVRAAAMSVTLLATLLAALTTG